MMTFKQLLEEGYINEAMHGELKNVLDSDAPEHTKLNIFSKKIQELAKRGEDSGLLEGKPKRGSSRAVFFPKEGKEIHIDGTKVAAPTAVKIAFAGALDKHTGDSRLLGNYQNETEKDNFTRHEYSVLRPHIVSAPEQNHYHYNPEGVVAPVLDSHADSHWIQMGKADKMTKGKFRELTKLPSHPEGLNFDNFTSALQNDHKAAHGIHVGFDDHNSIRHHPLFQKTQDFINDTGSHPGDLRLQNYGVWKHPVSGVEHPVIRDFGFSNNVSHLYTKAFRNEANARDEKFKARERDYMGI